MRPVGKTTEPFSLDMTLAPHPSRKKIQELDIEMSTPYINENIHSLLKQTVLFGGKRLRPYLLFLMADFFDTQDPSIGVCAESIEMVHAASLSHDDVLDQAQTRRGRPSINVLSSNKKAILAGDYLFSYVIVELVKLGNLHLVSEMARVISALSEGEWLQLEALEKRNHSHELLLRIAYLKTGSVMSWCTLSPAIVKQYPQEIIHLARLFGEELGLAFQWTDDLLDFNKSSQKDSHLDLENGVINSVLYEWLLLHPEDHKRFKQGENIIDLFHRRSLKRAMGTIQKKVNEKIEKCRMILNTLETKLSNFTSARPLALAKESLFFLLESLKNRKE